jgi:hypothetical protein
VNTSLVRADDLSAGALWLPQQTPAKLPTGICITGEYAMPFRYLAMIGFAALAVLTMPAAPAKADCVDDCQAATYCDSTMHASGECSEKLNQCYQLQCNKPRHAFGAIAYDRNSQAYGYSFNQPDGEAASAVALKNCQKHGSGCEVVYGFTDACAALAAGNTERYGIGEGGSRERAEKNAMTSCTQTNSENCKVLVWSCARP